MKRKVIQIAGSTQLVSLPRKWALKYDIQKGDELDVTEQANKLIVATEREAELNNITVDARKLNTRMIKWVLTAVYKSGYDEVEVLFEDPAMINVIQERIRELLGFMIIEHTKNRALIRSISQGIEQEFDSTMRRTFLVTLSMAESIIEMLKKGENIHLKDVTSLEVTNNQLANFCQRVLNKKGYKDSRKTTNLYVVISLLNIADSYKFICLYLSKHEYKNYKVSKETIVFFEKVNAMLKLYYEIFYNKDEKKLVSISEARYEIPEAAYKLMEKKRMPETAIISYLLEVYHRVLDSLDPYTSMQY